VTAVVALDTAFGDADGVFAAALAHLARKLAAIQRFDPAAMPADRAMAVAALDAAGLGNWRIELVRFYEDQAPVALRPDPELNALLRTARRRGLHIGVASPLPRAAVELFLSQLGVLRLAAVIAGEEDGDALAAARTALESPDAPLVETRAELVAALSA
jgi:phosphoglycolate phosphatase-like HAD superfamily hydrolase